MSTDAYEAARLTDRERLGDRTEGSALTALVGYLEAASSLALRSPPCGHWSSAEQFLLRRGTAFRRKPLPTKGPRLGMPKACFHNALTAARWSRGRLAYCEGYAWPAGLMAVHHAWVVDVEDGMALEVTWPDDWQEERHAAFAYVGLAFSQSHAAAAVGRSGCVIYDAKGRNPVLSGRLDERAWRHPLLPPAPVDPCRVV